MRILLEILTMAPRNTVVSAMAIFTLACAVLLGIPSTGFVAPRALEDSAGKAWTAYVQAQRQLQVEVADFLSSQRPDLKEVIVVSRDLQLGLIDRRSLEFRYLLETPRAHHQKPGHFAVRKFPLDRPGRHHAAKVEPRLRRGSKRVEVLRQRNDSNPQLPALREANQSLAKQPDYQKIYARFDQRVNAAEKLLREPAD
jgi:hypothetical protein